MKPNALKRAFVIFVAGVCAVVLSACSTLSNIVDTVAGDATISPVLPSLMTVPETSAPEPTEEPVYDAPATTVPFPDMVYERPDVPAMTEDIMDAASQMTEDASEQEALSLLGNVQNIYDDFRTAETLAMIHNSIDYSDAYWQQEFDYCTQNEADIQKAMAAFNQALSSSKAGRDAGLEPVEERVDADKIKPLLQKEAEIQNRYSNLLATATVDYEGEPRTYAECTTLAMATAWLDRNASELGDLYIQLVRVRNEIAAACDFDNYVDYAFYAADVDYTPEMMRGLLDDIAANFSSLFQEYSEKGPYSIGVILTEDDLFSDMAAIFSNLDPELNDALDFMRQYQLYDFSDGVNKESSDYTTYIVNYAAPFIQVTFNGAWDQASTVINEFGHFFNYTQDPDASYHSLENQEIFSEALELLATNFYSTCFSEEDAYMMSYDALANEFTTFPYQAYLSSFEYEVYSLPDSELTYDNLRDISQELWERYGFDTSDPMAPVAWTTTPHLFDTAFYTFAYILAGDVAMQLWEMSADDAEAAMEVYMTLMDGAKDDLAFLENVREAGLVSPFADGEMATQAGYFRSYLIYETAMYGESVDPIITSPAPSQSGAGQAQPEATFPIQEPSGRFGTFRGYTDGNSTEIYGDALDPDATPAPSPTPVPTPKRYNALDHRWAESRN